MTEEEKRAWNRALIKASSIAWNFHLHLGNGLLALLIRGTVKATGEAIARDILDLAETRNDEDHP